MTNLYPNPLQPHRAPFNRHQLRILNETDPVRVIAPVAWTDEKWFAKPWPRRLELDGITVDHPRYWFPPRVARGTYGQWYLWSVRRVFRRAIRDFEPDIVFAPWAYPDGWAAVKLARKHKLPVVVQVHGSDVKLLDDFPARKQRTIEALTQADGVVAVSQDLANDVIGIGAKNVRVIYDGVDPELFGRGSPLTPSEISTIFDYKKQPFVLFVGNLVPVKCVSTLIEAMEGVPYPLHVVGDGPLRESLKSQAERTIGISNTRFHGSLPLKRLPAFYKSASLLVLPSRSEGVPNVLLEASACGLPWVASNVGGIPEIAHLGASRLVPPGDVQALRTAILEMLENPPPQPDVRPRLRTEAVAELHAFLEETRNAHE
jgi:glycosyltransferase involved in cell wall biosynthesis